MTGVQHTPKPSLGPFFSPRTDVTDIIQSSTPGRVAGFISETIQGVGGAVPLADGYLPEVYKVSGVM